MFNKDLIPFLCLKFLSFNELLLLKSKSYLPLYSSAISWCKSGNSSVAGILQIVDSYANTSATIAGSASAVKTAYDTAVTAQNMAANAYSNAASVAATAYSNAVTQATTLSGTAYSNAVAYAASNTYVNTQLGLKADLASPTFTGLLTANNVTITGNLTVSGTTTYLNTTTLDIGDNIITLNADLGAVAPSENAGLEVMRGTSANVSFVWNETTDYWNVGNTTITGQLQANTGLLSANTIQFNDGSQQTTYIDPIAMAIALG